MRPAMLGGPEEAGGLLGASTKFPSSRSQLAEDAVGVVVGGGKLKQVVAGDDALRPTLAAGDGDRETPRPLPR